MRKYLVLTPRASFALLLLVATLALPHSVHAETFKPREGCVHLVTIQSKGCYVRHVVTCPEMGDGLLVYGTNKAGLVVATLFDADGATLFLGPKDAMMQLADRTDLLSLSALKKTGADTYDFTLADKAGAATRFVGTSTLTGEAVEIDGQTLSVIATRQVSTRPDGKAVESESLNYLDTGLMLLVSGETRDTGTGKIVLDRTPAEFLFPEEDGALAAEPRIGCEG